MSENREERIRRVLNDNALSRRSEHQTIDHSWNTQTGHGAPQKNHEAIDREYDEKARRITRQW